MRIITCGNMAKWRGHYVQWDAHKEYDFYMCIPQNLSAQEDQWFPETAESGMTV